jgi:transcriptional regulator with XRE-family HTH domain
VAIDRQALKILRIKDGSSVSVLARRVGISVQYLCDIESGHRKLKRNPALIKRLAEALNVPTSMLELRTPAPADEQVA